MAHELSVTLDGEQSITVEPGPFVLPSVGELQTKSVSPSSSLQNITADDGYFALAQVNVEAIPSNYVGSSIPRRTSGSVQLSGATFTAPAGYYSSAASATMPSTTIQNFKVNIGEVNNHSVNVTPSFTASDGYISGGSRQGTSSTVSASDLVSGTLNVMSNGVKDVTNYASVNIDVSTNRAPKKQINFIDYDGAIIDSYTASEWQNATALPSNPSHSGLVAQGWNWTKEEIDDQLSHVPEGDIWVGQMYITTSGDTEIDVRFADSARLSPILTIAVNGTVTVDWGDNTTDTVTGSSLTTRQAVPHTYASVGDYTIKIHVVSGSFQFYGTSSYLLLRKNTTPNENRVYANCARAVRFGSGATSIGNSAFYYCSSLASITIPSGVTSIGTNAFYYCSSLASITIPSGVTSIGNSAFSSCSSLASITIPSGVTSIGASAFSSCSPLASITIPSGVTSIGASAFSYCSSFASITIPSGVTSIEASAFSSCYGIAEYHIKPTTPPTLGTTAFNYIPSDCVIYVPSAKLDDYKTATNWSAYASYMQEEPQ